MTSSTRLFTVLARKDKLYIRFFCRCKKRFRHTPLAMTPTTRCHFVGEFYREPLPFTIGCLQNHCITFCVPSRPSSPDVMDFFLILTHMAQLCPSPLFCNRLLYNAIILKSQLARSRPLQMLNSSSQEYYVKT